MHNFLDPKLLPCVTTQTPCLEGFEVENLINPNFLQKGRGFIAYTTIKPPVDIDFDLVCGVSLSHITINARNGNQKCCGLEILAKTPTTDYVTISKTFFEEDGVVICNARKYSGSKKPQDTNEKYHLAFFKSNEFRTFLNATNVRIRILRTNFKTPALGGVEIWGWVSRKTQADTINSLLNRPLTNVSNNDNSRSLPDDFKIPEEFLDEITFEVMALPMTLPSGHSVDQTTLEKCISTDASCGRQPSDPFTGLQFCNGRKPVLNSFLKSRIDMFLLNNAHREETFSIRRTSGRTNFYNRKSEHPKNSTLENNKRMKYNNTQPSTNLDDALNQVLNSKDFVKFSSDDKTESTDDSCYKCKTAFVLYRLPCKHVFCRSCLISNDNFCGTCNQKYTNNQVERYHSQL